MKSISKLPSTDSTIHSDTTDDDTANIFDSPSYNYIVPSPAADAKVLTAESPNNNSVQSLKSIDKEIRNDDLSSSNNNNTSFVDRTLKPVSKKCFILI